MKDHAMTDGEVGSGHLALPQIPLGERSLQGLIGALRRVGPAEGKFGDHLFHCKPAAIPDTDDLTWFVLQWDRHAIELGVSDPLLTVFRNDWVGYRLPEVFQDSFAFDPVLAYFDRVARQRTHLRSGRLRRPLEYERGIAVRVDDVDGAIAVRFQAESSGVISRVFRAFPSPSRSSMRVPVPLSIQLGTFALRGDQLTAIRKGAVIVPGGDQISLDAAILIAGGRPIARLAIQGCFGVVSDIDPAKIEPLMHNDHRLRFTFDCPPTDYCEAAVLAAGNKVHIGAAISRKTISVSHHDRSLATGRLIDIGGQLAVSITGVSNGVSSKDFLPRKKRAPARFRQTEERLTRECFETGAETR